MSVTGNYCNIQQLYAEFGSGDTNISSDPQFQALCNAAWEASLAYKHDKSPINTATYSTALNNLKAYFSSNVPSQGDEPAYDVYNDIMSPIPTDPTNDLSRVSSANQDIGNTQLKSDISILLGDMKEYDWEMGLPSGQQDPALINSLLTQISSGIEKFKTDMGSLTGVKDGYLSVLLTQLTSPVSTGGSSLEALAAAVVANPGNQADLSALQAALKTVGETGNDGGDLRYMLDSSAYEEFGVS